MQTNENRWDGGRLEQQQPEEKQHRLEPVEISRGIDGIRRQRPDEQCARQRGDHKGRVDSQHPFFEEPPEAGRTLPTLHDQETAHQKEPVHRQSSEGIRAEDAPEGFPMRVAVDDLTRVGHNHQRGKQQAQEIKMVIPAERIAWRKFDRRRRRLDVGAVVHRGSCHGRLFPKQETIPGAGAGRIFSRVGAPLPGGCPDAAGVVRRAAAGSGSGTRPTPR